MALQLIVEDFNQAFYGTLTGNAHTVFVPYTSNRQYLPAGVKLATLNDSTTGTGINAAENTFTTAGAAPMLARVILFDGDGQLVTRNGLATQSMPMPPVPGTYPTMMGDWHFLNQVGVILGYSGSNTTNEDAASSPAFFLYNQNDLQSQSITNNDTAVAQWIHRHSSIVLVNPNTGTVSIDKGAQ